jgi:hypothetical protein
MTFSKETLDRIKAALHPDNLIDIGREEAHTRLSVADLQALVTAYEVADAAYRRGFQRWSEADDKVSALRFALLGIGAGDVGRSDTRRHVMEIAERYDLYPRNGGAELIEFALDTTAYLTGIAS